MACWSALLPHWILGLKPLSSHRCTVRLSYKVRSKLYSIILRNLVSTRENTWWQQLWTVRLFGQMQIKAGPLEIEKSGKRKQILPTSAAYWAAVWLRYFTCATKFEARYANVMYKSKISFFSMKKCCKTLVLHYYVFSYNTWSITQHATSSMMCAAWMLHTCCIR